MADHLTEEQIIRLCLARDDDPSDQEARLHLDAGCPACQARMRQYETVVSALMAPRHQELPPEILDKARAWIAQQEAAGRSPHGDAARGSHGAPRTGAPSLLDPRTGIRAAGEKAAGKIREIGASLVLDTLAGAVLPGVRGTLEPSNRHLLFESEAGNVHVLLDTVRHDDRKLQGQFVPLAEEELSSGGVAELRIEGRALRVDLSASGEFHFSGLPRGSLEIILEAGGHRIRLERIQT